MGSQGWGQFSFGMGGSGQIQLSEPIEILKIYVEDGREEPIRGGAFEGVTLRTLRDILAVGNSRIVYNSAGMGNFITTIVAPSVLVEELSLRKPPLEFDKPPILKNPYFK